MKKIYKNSLFMLVAGALVASCADYNVTDNFKADPDPTVKTPYNNLAAVKSYIDKAQYPNMSIGATLKASTFNEQALDHAAAVTNFDNLSFGNTLMMGSIINARGAKNFVDMKDLIEHVKEMGSDVYGSPIAANSNQSYDWMKTLTAPIEILVDYVEGPKVDYTTMSKFEGTVDLGTATMATFDKTKSLQIGKTTGMTGSKAQVRIMEGFKVDSLATYTFKFYVNSPKNATFSTVFCGDTVKCETTKTGAWTITKNLWNTIVVEVKAKKNDPNGYLRIDNSIGGAVYVKSVEMGYYPDNHRPQTEQEVKDTITYALNEWCDGLMKTNEGYITKFDLIEEPLDIKLMDNGFNDLKHSDSADKVYWQDVFGNEQYGPMISKTAAAAFKKYGGDADKLQFFISETGLDRGNKLNSLLYWINIWEKNGAKIDGINAKLNLSYSEDAATQAANETALKEFLNKLKDTGKLIRLSNFDITYKDATGTAVTAKDITDEQRQKLADYNAFALKSYMSIIPQAQQAGISKSNMVDSTDPVGLWALVNKDWVRTATYKAFCDALSGK